MGYCATTGKYNNNSHWVGGNRAHPAPVPPPAPPSPKPPPGPPGPPGPVPPVTTGMCLDFDIVCQVCHCPSGVGDFRSSKTVVYFAGTIPPLIL